MSPSEIREEVTVPPVTDGPVSTQLLTDLKLGNASIKPKGTIHLGRRMLLREEAGTKATTAFAFAVGLPEDGSIPAVEDPTPVGQPGELPMQSLQYWLEKTDEQLEIADRGLTMSYGIFGAPGSGKTHLMLRMLRQIFAHAVEDPDARFGALILDPKAALIEDITKMAAKTGRAADLVVLNAEILEQLDQDVNVIDADMDSYELARALVLAAQSAGVAASEPYWFGAWQNLFGAAIFVLRWVGEDVLTLRDLVNSVLMIEQGDVLSSAGPERRIQRIAREARLRLDEFSDDDQRSEAEVAINQIERFYAQEPEDLAVVENLITQSYGEFQRSRCKRYSQRIPKSAEHQPFYDRIIDEGTIVLVSVSPADPGLAKVLCTLIKNLFMQSVRSRLDRVRSGRLRNFTRPVVIACDEYSQVASEIPGQIGDGDFFSIARQQGCMGILATQSVNVLQATSLKENWKSIFSNFAAKIFMRAVDNETVEEATKLAGETDWYVTSLGTSSGKDGMSSSSQKELRERKVLPAHVLTQLIRVGQGVVIGTLDGQKRPATYFLTVPSR